MTFQLDTSSQIIRYVKNLSVCVDDVKITSVYQGGFYFRVKVPMWYKFIYGNRLWKTIQQELSDKIVSGISFKFEIYSENFF